jgi:uncharacterized membrane protein HdeD (DUF308 family)
MTTEGIKAVKKDATLLIIIGILMVFLGVFSIITPMLTGLAISVVIGIFLIIGGILQVIFALKAKAWSSGIWAFIIGLLTLICGLIMVFKPVFGLTSLTLVLAIYFIIDGLTEIMEAFKLKPINGWGYMLFGGIVSLLLGVLIWAQWPVSGAWAIGILVGVKLLFAGWAIMGIGFAGRSIADGPPVRP